LTLLLATSSPHEKTPPAGTLFEFDRWRRCLAEQPRGLSDAYLRLCGQTSNLIVILP
jgi:hypothetical protein